MNAVSGIILVILLTVVASGSRRWALLAMMVGVFFLTQGQSVDLAGLNLYPIRFLLATAFIRVVLRRELVSSQLNKIDWTLLLAYNYSALVWVLRSPQFQAEQFAFALDASLCYLSLRGLMAELEDLRWLLLAFAPLLLVFTSLVALERVTGESSFTLVGANWGLYVREGIARCSGTFRHASLLGSVAAAFLALYVSLWWRKQDRAVAVLGAALRSGLVLLSNSGGPVTSVMAAAAGWALWPLRGRMRAVRYAMVGILVLLILFMKAPIWYLPFKLSMVVGGGGYHRGALMESAWHDIHRWWLFGMNLQDTLPWIPYAHGETGGVDVTNEFIVFAIKGGLAALLLLILVLSLSFGDIGRKMSSYRLTGAKASTNEALLWGVGVAIGVHAVSWLGIAYFDQSWVVWLLHLAAVSAAVEPVALENTGLSSELLSNNALEGSLNFRAAYAPGHVRRPAKSRSKPYKRFRRLPWAHMNNPTGSA